ncbi:hypothetical protein BC749_102906 [Flavobacterium araucananum]|uniref:Uncharacterized protein n=2 Tax=Flavobacterium araucananum TaxID=946678 RepID=A0A227PB36_9FLAO|nr:hypothetical protein [Flavobacterium araucananum]OXG07131.1 hypothetical protein B0A64_09985 [Flavobacterium araucananum]PWK01330.1 hypothetical protein BC749_102906 [Flavobacterium araucananum]
MGADSVSSTLPFFMAVEAAIVTFFMADFWNPLGWIAGVIAAVLIVVIGILWVIDHYEQIMAYVIPVRDATAGWVREATSWCSETANKVWDYFVEVPVAIPFPETKPLAGPIDRPLPITIPIDTTKPSEGGPWNVYDVHIIAPGVYGDYQRGFPDNPVMLMMFPPEIYKYGRTRYSSVMRRYEAFRWTSKKEAMILRNLEKNIFGALEWYATRTNNFQSIFIEKGLITAYYNLMGKYPPGNTGPY